MACRNHMFLSRKEDVERDICFLCCMKEGTTPDTVALEYLPMLPRIKSWTADETSYGMSLNTIGRKLLNGHPRLKIPRTKSSMKPSSKVTSTRKLGMTAEDQALLRTIFLSPEALTRPRRLKIRATTAGLLRTFCSISRLICALLSRIEFMCAILSRIEFQFALSKGPRSHYIWTHGSNLYEMK